jgi:hypothetical protein
MAWHPLPMFDVSRWRNLNDNLGRKGAQGQGAHKDNSDHSFQKT